MQTGMYRLWLRGHDGGSVIGRAWDIRRVRGIKGRLTRRGSWYPLAMRPASRTAGGYSHRPIRMQPISRRRVTRQSHHEQIRTQTPTEQTPPTQKSRHP